MAYPRSCIGCGVQYSGPTGQGTLSHVTLVANDGGTSSPCAPDLPGRLLDIGCKACGAVVRWDYFGPAEDGRLGSALSLVRPPVDGWMPGDPFAFERGRRVAFEPERRAS